MHNYMYAPWTIVPVLYNAQAWVAEPEGTGGTFPYKVLCGGVSDYII